MLGKLRYWKYRCLLLFFGTVVALTAGAALLFWSMGRMLAVETVPAAADVGVVLAGDYGRSLYAAELYRDGFIQRIWVTRPIRGRALVQVDALDISYPRQEEVTREILLKKGVPAERIKLIGHELSSTMAEAKHVVKVLRTRPDLKRILVIAGQAHVRRAQAIFDSALESLPGVTVLVLGTPHDEFIADRWWTDRDSARQVVLESAKLILFWFITELE